MKRMRPFKRGSDAFIDREQASSLEIYLSDIVKYKLLTEEEEPIVAKAAREGDKTARETLVNSNLRFVLSVVKQYQGRGLTVPDLIQEGNFGLVKASERFDERRGFKFFSYAVWWIRQSILLAISQQFNIVTFPAHHYQLAGKIDKANDALKQELEREPSDEELRNAVKDMSPKSFARGQGYRLGKKVRIDLPVTEGFPEKISDLMPGEHAADSGTQLEDLRSDIALSFNRLKGKEAEVLRRNFGLGGHSPENFDQIGNDYDLTRERIRQIKVKGLKRLNKGPTLRLLEKHLSLN